MYNNWFECKVKGIKISEDGKINKPSIVPFLVDAMTFTEAEAKIVKEVRPYLTGEIIVEAITKAKISEIIDSTAESDDRWYKCKVAFIVTDEKSAKEKLVANTLMVKAGDTKSALTNLEIGMKNSLVDYTVVSLTETKILDIFKD